jgi:iron complex outermembrane receptor protein
VPDFTTLAGNRADFQPVLVTGGSPSFDEPLFNIGGVITPVPGLRLYGTFAQAYTMPDVGRVLRGISAEGTAVDDFLNLVPIKTDNREVGATLGNAWGRLGASYFESESDNGSRLVPNADGFFQVVREPTKTSGWELTGRLVPTARLALDAGYSRLDGRFDSDRDGRLDSDLSAADIGPDRLNLSADLNRGGRVSGRIQGFHFFDRTFRDAEGQSTAEFDGYDTVDATLAFAVGRSTLSLSVANLFDAQYITYYSQAATDLDDRYFAGRGRTLTLRVESRF